MLIDVIIVVKYIIAISMHLTMMMTILTVVVVRFGRRRPLLFFHLTAAVVLFANIFIPRETGLVPTILSCLLIGLPIYFYLGILIDHFALVAYWYQLFNGAFDCAGR